MLVCEYPMLSLVTIHKVIAFYLENKSEVDTYIARCQQIIDQQRQANPRGSSLAELRERI